MSLLLLLKPNGVAVIPPPTPAPVVSGGRGQRIQSPQLVEFPAGRARILFRAIPADLLLLPEFRTAGISLRSTKAQLDAEISSRSKKHPLELTYRAVRDEPEDDEEFRRLVEAAYLLTR